MAKAKTNIYDGVKRYRPSLEKGLNDEQVAERIASKLTNSSKKAVGKSTWEIIQSDVFSFFNVLLFIIAGFLIWAGQWKKMFFLVVLLCNMTISLIQDFKAKRLLEKMSLMTQPVARILRNGEIKEMSVNDIVLDDIIYLSSGDQIPADGVIKEGVLYVNEALLTGESHLIVKNPGDRLLSGSFVTSGNAKVSIDVVGRETFAASLQSKANEFRRSPSQILKSLKLLFRFLAITVILFAIATLALYYTQGSLSGVENVKKSIVPISGSMIGMIPCGLYLLTSVTLAKAVITLSKKNAQVQDLYSVEMLARVNVLCVDKTGTITDGTMNVSDVISLRANVNSVDIKQIACNIVHATKDNNSTSKAIKKSFGFKSSAISVKALPFMSENKYSAASFKGGETFVMGAIEYLKLQDRQLVISKAHEYTSKGYRVVVVGQCLGIEKDKIYGEVTPLGLLVIKDHIKEDAIKTFKWFADNNVDIVVISGDNAETVSEVAKSAGIKDAHKFISIEGMSEQKLKSIVCKYKVFGRVNPEQKEIIVQTLKELGKTVAMTGDGVNDILALKRADCSIAMASGSDAARSVSHIVLMDNNFSSLPNVVAEGRRVINNIQRTASLFLTKTLFAITFSFVFLLVSVISKNSSIRYPFASNNFYLWEMPCIGIAAFFIALEPNNEQIKGNFLRTTFKKVIPNYLLMTLPCLFIYFLFMLQTKGIIYTGILADIETPYTSEIATSMCVILISILSCLVLMQTCRPFSKYRGWVFGSIVALVFYCLVGSVIYSYSTGKENIFGIQYLSLTYDNLVRLIIIFIVSISIFFAIERIKKVVKEEKENVNNK